MKTLNEPDDEMAPIEETDGYIGHSWEGDLYYGRLDWADPLMALRKFDWSAYYTLVEDSPTFLQSKLHLELSAGPKVVTYEAEYDIAYLLDELPSIEAYEAGAGFVFTNAEGADDEDVRADVAVLLAALQEDYNALLSRAKPCGDE